MENQTQTKQQEIIFRSKLPDIYIPKHLPLHSYCFENISEVASRPCLINGSTGHIYTYREVELTARKIASGLNNLGIQQYDAIMLLLPNTPEFVLSFLGASYRGAIATAANPFFTPAEIAKQAKASNSKLVITQACYVDKVKDLPDVKIMCIDSPPDGCLHFSEVSQADESILPNVEIRPDDVVALPFSSGTTGLPKGVMLTHKGLVTSVAQQVDGENPNLYFHSRDVILCVLPLFHIYALNSIMLCGLRAGAAILIMQKFEINSLLQLAERYRITVAPVVPPIVLAIAKSPETEKYDLSSIRILKSGAAPLGKELEDTVRAKFPNATLGQGYGMTEAGPVLAMCLSFAKEPFEIKAGACGTVVRNAEMKIVDPETGASLPRNKPGEICIKGDQIMKGYLNDLEATKRTIAEEGWLQTGDIGYIDDDDELFIVDRLKELIKYKGFQVAPAELEALLLSHSNISDAAVVPMKDEAAGEVPVAFVVKSNNSQITEDEIKQFISKQVVFYKRINRVFFIDSIPKAPSGKILRKDLRAKMLTLQEKIQQLSDNASAIPRLGIPAYEWWSESLHGIATNGPGVNFNGTVSSSTSFPQVLLSAASFNRSLWSKIGSAIAVEARAMYNLRQAGLTFWAPNINIFRDPRWGRGQETPGEDPMVVSAYAVEFVKSFQGQNWKSNGGGGGFGFGFGLKRVLKEVGEESDRDDGLMLSACCKHLIAYDLEKWRNFSRYSFNAMVTEQDMEDTFLPPFRSCIEQGKASCIMCSYNQVNGVPACLRGDLFQKARNEWGFKGYITSDCDAVATIYEYQNYTKMPEDSVAGVLKAGMDTNCGTYMLRHTQSAIDQGKVQEEEIDRALFNLFSVQLRLGLFNGDPKKGKFGKLGPQDVCTPEHKKLALDAARQGIVLLKNDKQFLPLNKDAVLSLAIIGPLANNISQMGGGYTGIPCSPKSLYGGLNAYVSTTYYASGCRDVPCGSDAGFSEAVHTAKKADFVIVVAGLDLSQETEDHDRVSLLLPGKQMSLVTSVASASKRPVILVLTGGGPLDISFAKEEPHISSILWIGYPGEAGAKALAEIIFGNFNPGGRLPMTWYPESFTKVPMNDMNMRADPSRDYPGRTYRFYNGNQVYGFGHGLSYSNYIYKFLSAPSKLSISTSFKASSSKNILKHRGSRLDYAHIDEVISCTSLKFYVQVSVMNAGDVDGSHAVMLFARVPKVFRGTPEKQLIGFDRVHTVAKESKEISILVDPCEHLSIANEHGKRILPLGNHVLMVGDMEHFLTIETY